MHPKQKSFYVFKGSWFDIFDKLTGFLKPRNTANFTVWEAKSQKRMHLLITYGAALPNELQRRHDLIEISEPEFQSSFKPVLSEHIIHGYNEFNSKPSGLNFFRF